MKKVVKAISGIFLIVLFGSCTSIHQASKDSNAHVNFEKSDFQYSEKVTADAVTVKIIGIDWARIFSSKSGSIDNGAPIMPSPASLPIVGGLITDNTQGYALYELFKANPGYDAVFYPNYKTSITKPFLGLGFILKVTKVEATARLGKLKVN